MSLKNLNLPLPCIRSPSWLPTDGVALGLVATLHIKNPLDRDRQGKNQPIQNQIRGGAQGTLSLILQRNGGKITCPRRGHFECAAWLLSQEQRHR